MFSTLLIVSIALASQVSAPNDRYPDRGATQPVAPGTLPGSSSAITPIGGSTSPFSTPARPNNNPASPAPNSTYSPSRPQPYTPNTAPNTSRPASPAYPTQPNLGANDSAAAQLPSKSALLMQAMLARPAASQLSGDSVRLVDVIAT